MQTGKHTLGSESHSSFKNNARDRVPPRLVLTVPPFNNTVASVYDSARPIVRSALDTIAQRRESTDFTRRSERSVPVFVSEAAGSRCFELIRLVTCDRPFVTGVPTRPRRPTKSKF